jgi:hypothetical protein
VVPVVLLVVVVVLLLDWLLVALLSLVLVASCGRRARRIRHVRRRPDHVFDAGF